MQSVINTVIKNLFIIVIKSLFITVGYQNEVKFYWNSFILAVSQWETYELHRNLLLMRKISHFENKDTSRSLPGS